MRTNNRTLKCESLENRELMAGNVTVSVVANEVRVAGDNNANQIEVWQLDNGAYRIFGHSGTKVNGQTFVDRFSPDKDLRISLGSGADSLWLGNHFTRAAMVCEDLEIDMGTGKDYALVSNVKTTDNQFASIRMGGSENDADVLNVEKSTIKTGLKVEMGGGADKLDIRTSKITGKLDVNLGAGDDSINLVDAVFSSSSINGGSGTDTYKRTRGTATSPASFEKFL